MCHPEVPPGQPTPVVATREVSIPLRSGEKLPTLVAETEAGATKAVLIAHDVFGRSPFYENLAARLATAGFTAILPDLFFRQGGLPERTLEHARDRRLKMDEANAVTDCLDAIAWLRDEGASGRVGTVGFCLGGTLVLNLAAERNDLANVCYYGFPAAQAMAQRFPGVKTAPVPLERTQQMSGPMLGFWGDQDFGVGMDNVRALDAQLTAAGVDHRFTIYPGLNHGFLGMSNLDPNHEAYALACRSWTDTIHFFREEVG